MSDMKRSEILAPAGNPEALTAAVYSGADAVYLGSRDFNARKNAANFSDEDFLQAVAFCRRHGVRVYQTVNTVLYDDELPALRRVLELSCRAGVDALIIQDMAVYKTVRNCCPSLPLHASTQMSVHTTDGVKMLEELGFERVVLSREMSREQIAAVLRETSVETEVFVHGALCMCVSGQCYLSAMIGQRSGNRGLCAQPCRLPFSANQSRKESHDLSLKDLSLIDQLRELSDLGVTSMKIEGRMKRPEYVAAAVTACRQALDDGFVAEDLRCNLSDVFSRSGFTDGYYTGKTGKSMFGFRTKADVTAADSAVFKSLAQLCREEYPRFPVDMTLTARPGLAVLKATDGTFTAQSESTAPQPAVQAPTDEAAVRKNLSKTGGTPYFLHNLTFSNDGAFLPVSAVNELRRTALSELTRQRESFSPVPFQDYPAHFEPHPAQKPDLWVRLSSRAGLTDKVLREAARIILPLYEIDAATVSALSDRLIAELPRGKFGTEKAVLEAMKRLLALGVNDAMIHNIGDLLLCREVGMKAHGGFGLNITNSAALWQYQQWGLCDAVVSFELSLPKIRDLKTTLPRGIMAYGRFPLMLTRNCPGVTAGGCTKCNHRRVLTDRRGIQFPVVCSGGCSEILNSLPVYLADKPHFSDGCDYFVLYFTLESPSQIDGIIDEYTHKHSARDHITRGLYLRGSL